MRSKHIKNKVIGTTRKSTSTQAEEGIAVIGMACRFPGALDYDEFWRNLEGVVNSIVEIPKDRWDWRDYFGDPQAQPNKTNSKWGGFVEDIDKFDAAFFKISPIEAQCVDPQQRLMLELSWSCLEDAGYAPSSLDGRNIGVFIGCCNFDYKELQERYAQEIEGHASTGVYVTLIPNRISYFFNFHGVSVPIDAACASSLVATHQAVKSLRNGESAMALVGGVSVLCTPTYYISFSKTGMLTKDGQCKTFDKDANGYVRGEGGGILLLKRIKDAIKDRDRIYGVIKSSAVNHGGRVRTLTSPSMYAQSKVIKEAFREGKIDPVSVTYIEAHGTGTSLGDPIEVNALKRAFTSLCKEAGRAVPVGSCGLGTVKTNIGHLESAAGIAGMIKVLLSLRYRKLPGILNYKELNPRIRLEDSPFYIVEKTQEWETKKDKLGKQLPRRAGVSSFGFGGVNAHVVIEEYLDNKSETIGSDSENLKSFLVVLSAKTEDRLKEAAKNLHNFLTGNRGPETVNLQKVAYILQVGREAMDERLAFVVADKEELEQKFLDYLLGKENIPRLYKGAPNRDKNKIELLLDEPSLLDQWLIQKALDKLARFWVSGGIIDWKQLVVEEEQRIKIALPTYPFARERYWISEKGVQSSGFRVHKLEDRKKLHPLVHENTSTLKEQRFSSKFTGEEFFLKDHHVKGQSVLPGVAYLEMAREAVTQAAEDISKNQAIHLKNITWARPIVVSGDLQQVHIGLFPDKEGEIAYGIYTQGENGIEEQVVHSQGVVTFSPSDKNVSLDLVGLQTTINQSKLTSEYCYGMFKSLGIDYGPNHQGIETIYIGNDEVLAKLALPPSVSEIKDQFILHPSLLDSALQCSIGMGLEKGLSGGNLSLPSLPFALERLEIFACCKETMWVWMRFSQSHTSAKGIQTLDIDLCDEKGKVCVKMRGFSSRLLREKLGSGKEINPVHKGILDTQANLITMSPVWNAFPIEKVALLPKKDAQMIIVGGRQWQIQAIRKWYPQAQVLEIGPDANIDVIMNQLEAQGFHHLIWIASNSSLNSLDSQKMIQAQNQGVLQVFRIVKALLSLGYDTKALAWTLITIASQAVRSDDQVNPTCASVHGLIGSLAKEYPHWQIRLVDLQEDKDWPVQEIFRLPYDAQGNALAYRDKEWFSQAFLSLHDHSAHRAPYKTGGVYVVIGGAGGIGEAWTQWMLEKYQAQIIWLGRRKKDPIIQTKLDSLSKFGLTPTYIQADASNLESLRKAYAEIKQKHAQIHGVIHSAIVLSDSSFANMDEDRFKAGLNAKVDVCLCLANVFKHEALDFVLFFSSLMAFSKAPGQSNYAAGCTFKDAFAYQLAQDWPCSVKVMNWGYWGNIGIVTDSIYQARMKREGIGSIEPEEGMEVLEKLLSSSFNQLALIKTLKTHQIEQTAIRPINEWVESYPQTIPLSPLRNLENLLTKQAKKWKGISATLGLERQEIETVCYKLLSANLQPFLKSSAGVLARYNRWLQESFSILSSKGYLQKQDDDRYELVGPGLDLDSEWQEWDQQKVCWAQNTNQKAQMVLVEACLRALPKILTAKQQATAVIFPNASMALVEAIYKDNEVSDLFNDLLGQVLERYIQERLAENSSCQIRILEIGAGIGGTTGRLLPKLSPFKDTIQEYCYTDISQAFLIHAQKHFTPLAPYLKTQIFDVEKPIAAQNIRADHYDVVIATNVLHATRNIRQTLRNAKAPLHKGGVMLLNELSDKSLFTHLTFGLLEGWWLYEDARLRIPGSPCIHPKVWRRLLKEEGFISTFFPAEMVHELGQQIIVTQSDGTVRQKQPANKPGVKKVETKETRLSARSNVSQALQIQENSFQKEKAIHGNIDVTDQMVTDHVRTILIESIANVLKMDAKKIQGDQSFSEYGVDSIIAVQLVNQINKKCKILLQTTVLFDYNSVDQLTKHITEEHKAKLVLDLQENTPLSTAEPISQLQKELAIRSAEKPEENSYRIRMSPLKDGIRQEVRELPKNSLTALNQPTYYKLVIDGPGRVDDLKISETVVEELKENEVRISVRAFSLNFGDLLCVKGLYPTMPPYPFTPGFDAAGIVVAVGSAVTSVRPGDSVIAGFGEDLGGQANMVTCLEERVILKPSVLSYEAASALPTVALTMIDTFHKANLKAGERILIQAAAGGTGLIAVQLAKHYGAEIYATAGSQHKLDFLEKLGIPHRINYQKCDFEQEVKRLTNGRGVDVVINTLSGEAIQKGMNCLAPAGRYVEIAMTALKSAKMVDLSVFCNNQSFYSVDLRKLELEDPAKVQAYRKEIVAMVEQGILHPTICKVFPFHQIKEAYRFMEDRRNIGKIVVTIPEESQFRQVNDIELPAVIHGNSQGRCSTGQISIAVVGMSGRFSQSEILDEFWDHLSNGADLVNEVSRWDLAQYYPNVGQNEHKYCNWGSFLEHIDQFDPLFFNISPLEATYMDPQQRLFLEECWKSLENAGYAGEGVMGKRCGIFVGCAGGDYARLFSQRAPAQAFWGNAASIIPARIAYYLNLQGPAVAIDTACSSSLVAIHMACQSLLSKETEMALAGGVFIQSTPKFYLSANEAGMLSPTGRCHTFDGGADGFVPGEGVGVIVLKRLEEAISDGDHIYGIIRGSGINQDGTTNGITAPSVQSQERLEKDVYDRFQINPQTIGMVEAHGTGTKLGDPIEVEALRKAFGRHTGKEAYCALGSVKTNIGHLATAAGVAGVFKILLSLKHKKIPPTLHYKSANSHIQFEKSPFYVNTKLQDWDVPKGSRRRAAISSFGFSGTNAHMVIEEAPHSRRSYSNPTGYLLVLSGRTWEQLRAQVKNMLKFCTEENTIDLGNLSYTLLLGRKHLDHRLACVVRSQKEFIEFLEKWLEKEKVLQVYTSYLGDGEVREQALLKRYGNQCIQECQTMAKATQYLEHLSTIADLYIQGYRLTFEKLFTHGYSRIPLPTYPFARERYWIKEISDLSTHSVFNVSHFDSDNNLVPGNFKIDLKLQNRFKISELRTPLHPLVQENTSDLWGPRFTSTFTGHELFFSAHGGQGQKVLTNGAYLEMARAAVEQAAGSLKNHQTRVQLKNILWAQPLAFSSQEKEVHIGLFGDEDGQIAYEIYTEATDEIEMGEKESEKVHELNRFVVHSKGVATLCPSEKRSPLDLSSLRATMDKGHLNFKQCDDAFNGTAGIEYGSSHHCIKGVYIGRSQVLVKLFPLPSVLETQDQFVLHPSLMDSALQASIALNKIINHKSKVKNPYFLSKLDSLTITERCEPSMWAWIRYSAGYGLDDKDLKLDINLYDDRGRICLGMTGISFRVLEREIQSTGIHKTLTCYPIWREKAISKEIKAPTYSQHLVMLCDTDALDLGQSDLAENIHGSTLIRLQADGDDMAKRYRDISVQAFETIKGILDLKPKGKILFQILTSHLGDEQLFRGLSGLLKTAQLENPKIVGQLIEIDFGETKENVLRAIGENDRCSGDTHIRYWQGQRQVLSWEEVPALRDDIPLPWKEGGVYLITGGVGGLGLIFAKEIAKNTKNATLILVGRSASNPDKHSKLKELLSLGARPVYRRADISEKKAVNALVQSIGKEFGYINGILHSAGVIFDNYILKKTIREFELVLAPKVAGTVYLDQATKDFSLDFFVLFSSLAGNTGNAGQADYACANAFMDAYATYRNTLICCGQRHGQTLSINWPLWKEGGMRIDEATERVLQRMTGMVAMETSNGIQAFARGLSSKQSLVMVMEGDLATIKQRFLRLKSKTKWGSTTRSVLPIDAKLLQEKTVNELKRLLGEIIKLSTDRIDSNESLETYGIDSIMIAQLNQKLETIFGEAPKTLFFEYQTLAALANYFVSEFPHECTTWTGLGAFASTRPETPSVAVSLGHKYPVLASTKSKKKWSNRFSQQVSDTPVQEPIAIIGMSGRYPKAKNLDEFWENLKKGRNCIHEIPEDRWPLEAFFEADSKNAVVQGKSYSKWGGFLDDFADFDPFFFNISPQDAMAMDPRERLFIMECWWALEDTGYSPSRFDSEVRKRIGVFSGITRAGISPSFASLVNRVSYFMDFNGPSLPVDTMCSSALVALAQACQGLHQREICLALVGAVNLHTRPESYQELCQAQLVSTTPRAKVFEEGGDGFIPSEGVGVVLLKRLAEAEGDGDHILAIIRGWAVNHSGKTNGYRVPSPSQQAAVIEAALETSNIDPRSISYIESAASGSEMGDAVELEALRKVFQAYRTDNRNSYYMGSLKSTVGHGESVAGMTQLMKVILQLKYKTLCPTPVSGKLNPNVNFDALPFKIHREPREWKPLNLDGSRIPRRAGITSIGAGGVNAHIIVEEYDFRQEITPGLPSPSIPVVFVLSAKTSRALRNYLIAWKEFLEKNHDLNLGQIAYSVQIGREVMKYRFSCVVQSRQELIQCIENTLNDKSIPNCYRGPLQLNEGSRGLLELFDENLIESLMDRHNFDRLAQLWAYGASIPWINLYKNTRVAFLTNIPKYPFSRKRYWSGAANGRTISGNNGNFIQASEAAISLTPTKSENERTEIPHFENRGGSEEVPQDSRLDHHTLGDHDTKYNDDVNIRKEILDIIGNLLNLEGDDEFDDQANFLEMGFSSITIVTFIEALNERFDIQLRQTAPFDYPTIKDMAEYIGSLLLNGNAKTTSISKSDLVTPEIASCNSMDGIESCAPSINPEDLQTILLDFEKDNITIEEALELAGLNNGEHK